MDAKPTYEELEKRCYTAEAILKAIRTGEADTVMSEQGLLVLRLEKELIETRVLYALSRALNEIGTFENAIQKAADLMAETLKVDRLNIILFDLAAQTILHYARGGPGKHNSVEVPFAELQEGLSGWVLQNHQAALSPKAGPDPRESQTVQARRQATHSGAIIVVPILYHKTLLGTLTAINRLEQRDFTQDDVELLEAVAHQTGVLIRNNQLYTDLRQEVALRQQTQRELETAYAEQEQRVKERTAELAEKNQVLEREVLERKKAEEKAQANERVLQLFVEYAPAAIAMLDREMKYIAASRRYLLDYRLGEQNLVGRSHYEIFPEIPDRWKEIHRRCLAGATEKAEEDPFPRGDGTLDWVRWEIHPWYENSGDLGGIILFSEVITERIQAKLALQEREQKLQQVLELLPVGVSILGAKRQVVYENPALHAILGITPEELRQGTYQKRKYIGADGSPLPFDQFASVRAEKSGQAVHNIETGIVKENGETIWANVSAVPVNFSDWKTVIVTSNLTQRKHAEEALRRSEERFRTTFEGMLEGTQIIDFDWRYTYLNATAEKHNRRPNQELLGRRYMDMWPGIEETHVFTLLKSCMEERTAHHIENEFVFPDGMVRWYELSIQPVPEGIFILSIDITERKLIEESLRQSEEKYRLLAENISDVIWILDMQTSRFRYISPSIKHLRGYSAEEALALDMGASLTPASAQHLAQVLPARLEKFSQGVINYYTDEVEQPCKGGGTVWTETTTRFIIDPETGQLEVYGVSRDITERKRAEEQRAELVERLDLATSAARMGIWDWDIQNNVLVWDEQMVRLYGLQPGEFAGAYEAWVNGIHPEDREASDENSARARRGEGPYDTEFRVIWPDGSIHWLKANGEVFLDAHGSPLRMVGVNYDITERKLAEAALRQSEENFSKAFKSTPAALLMTRLSDGKIIELNEAYSTIVGYSHEELLGRRTTELNIYLDTADRQQIVERLLRTGSTRDVELDIRHRSGAIRHVIAAQEMITFNGETCILTSLLDITSRKQLEEAVRTASQRFQLMLQSLYGGILVLNNDNQVEFANHAFCELFDLQDAPDALLGLQARNIIEKITQVYADPPLAIARIAEIVNAQQPVQDEEIAISGGRTYLRDFIPIEIAGHLYGRMWHHLDITERKRAEAELHNTLEELKRSNAELEQFAYVASHDLQEPLRAVAGMVQLLQQRYQGQLDARADEYIRHAVDAAGRMQTLINDLLTFSRVDRHGRIFAPVDSALCLQAALKNLDFSAHESNAKITWENLPTLTADGMQLIQLFQNLISNGLKFQGSHTPEIHIRAERVKNTWQFSVRDNGIGIDPQYFERIFLIFQRLHTRREYPGTGVGLAICKKIVERHGGQIWVESQPGQGSTFTFTIPT